MRRPLPFTLVFSLLTAGCSASFGDDRIDPTGDAPESAGESFEYEGVWRPAGAMLNGQVLLPRALEAIRMRIDGNEYEVAVEGEPHTDRGLSTWDEHSTPKRMTIMGISGPNAGKTFYAIYEIKGAERISRLLRPGGTRFSRGLSGSQGLRPIPRRVPPRGGE